LVNKKKRADLTYVVSSHPKYLKAMGPLLDSMYVAGVDAGEILVVLNDCSEEDYCGNFRIRSGTSYVTINNNIFEYGANVGVIKAIEDGVVPRTNDFVIIHDTCIAGNNFKRKCLELQESRDTQIVWAAEAGPAFDEQGRISWRRYWDSVGAFNIGIYRYEALKYAANLLKETVKMDKDLAIQMEHNKNHMSIKNMPVSQSVGFDSPVQIIGQYDVYGEGKARDVAYLRSMDLYKFFLWVAHGSHHPNKI